MSELEKNGDTSDKLSAVIKKAKRKTILRNIIISSVISVIVFGGGYIGNYILLNERGWDAYFPLEHNKKITGPNLYHARTQFSYGFLSGTLSYQTYKLIEDRVVPWERETYEYDIWRGQAGSLVGNHSNVQLNGQDGTQLFYNPENGEREMLFYHPQVSYGKYINDVTLLDKVGDDKYVELALSLNRSYTKEEINKMLPQGVTPTWYWVDSYTKWEIDQVLKNGSPVQAQMVYGFQRFPDPLIRSHEMTVDDFIKDVEKASDSNPSIPYDAKAVKDAIKQKPKNELIIGVVVTGSSEQLKKLMNQPYIKAATLGATVEKY